MERMIKRLVILAVVLGGQLGFGQLATAVQTTPNCVRFFTFTVTANVVTGGGAGASLANYGVGSPDGGAVCTSWKVAYAATTGISALSLSFQSAPAGATMAAPGTFGTYAGNVTTGINPNTSATGAEAAFGNGTTAIPWVRMNLTSATGTGTVFGLLQGWNAGNAKSGGGGGSGTVTSIATSCFVTGGTITGSGTIKSAYAFNPIVSSSYAIQSTDCGTVIELNRVGTVATTIAQAGTTGFQAGWWTVVDCTFHATTCTITPAAGLINGAVSFTLTTGQSATVASNGTNYDALVGTGVTANQNIRSWGASFDGAGSPLSAGGKTYMTVPFACTITAWNITVDTGTITFDIWKIATGTAIPTVANTITASALPAISTGTAIHSTTISGWTTGVSANDIIGININTVASATKASLVVQCNAT